jgi:hypothetical protein
MPSRNKHSQPSHVSRQLVALTLFAAAVALAPNVGAQGKNGSALGPVGGTLGSGASAGSNRGGAAGVSNPSPGGSPSSLGGPAQSSGPQSMETSRPGYLGGRTTNTTDPTDPINPVTPPTQAPGATTPILNVTQFGKCPTVSASSPQTRMSGNNSGRINTVANYLSPGQESSATARYLLADMQEELEKPHPDLTLAATYLGIASGVPITPALVSEVSESLCSPVSHSMAEAIAPAAEAQRTRMLLGR